MSHKNKFCIAGDAYTFPETFYLGWLTSIITPKF